MQKVLYLSWTEKMSGGEISIINYIKALQQQKEQFSPLFICPKEGRLTERVKKEGIPYHILPLCSFSFKKPWYFFIALAKLISFIQKERITHIHNTSFYSNQIAVIAGRICSIPVVTHGQSFVTTSEIKRNLLPYADKIIACSAALKNNLLPLVKKENIDILWHAIPIPLLNKKTFWLHKGLHIPKNSTLIGHVGLLEERKRQEDLIHAIPLILEKHRNVHFLIIGNAQFGNKEYENYLHSLVHTLDVKKHVHFVGFQDDIQRTIQELDIVALPSLHEPFSLAMLEAMSLEKPFIGADSGGTSEFIQHMRNGMLIAPKDSHALAHAILFLLENKNAAKRIGENGRVSVQKNCNIDLYAKKLRHIYSTMHTS